MIFDIETDGFLDALTRVHCLVLKDADTGEVVDFSDDLRGPGDVERGVKLLAQADEIIGHNIIKFDIPALRKVYPWFAFKGRVFDTLLAARLVKPETDVWDGKLVRLGRLPPKVRKFPHSLEAWGYRLGQMKCEYGKDDAGKDLPGKWDAWNDSMHAYCIQDVEVTDALLKWIEARKPSPASLALEFEFADIMARQERHGFAFDRQAATFLYEQLVRRRLELAARLTETFAPKRVETVFVPKVNNKARGYVKGEPFTKVSYVEFNPSSRQMIADRLKALGWEPTEFTDSGQAKIDEGILGKLDYPEAALLAEHFLVEKRIGMLAEGDQAWLRLERNGRIHGGVNTIGAVTGRCTHSNPNVAQVPKVGTPYGADCRALFMASAGKVLVGADLSGLELRCLAHFMAKYDGGAYAKVLLEGDIHWVNVQALGLTDDERDDHNILHKIYRNGAKTFIYAFLYGAGDKKIGETVLDIVRAARREGIDTAELEKRFFRGRSNPSEDDLKAAGKKLKSTFLKKVPALKLLKESIELFVDGYRPMALPERVEDPELWKQGGDGTWWRKRTKGGYLIGLDGRKLFVRSAHAALNTLLQSAGALIAKQAAIFAFRQLTEKGRVFGKDYAFVANVHDELQAEAKKELADELGRSLVECFRLAGEHFNFRVRIDGEYKVGANWRETH